MAKKIIKEVELCDVCGRESTHLSDCISCENEYCLMCEAVMPGCVHSVTCCTKCSTSERVVEIVMRYAPRIKMVIDMRDAELRQLCNKHVKKGRD